MSKRPFQRTAGFDLSTRTYTVTHPAFRLAGGALAMHERFAIRMRAWSGGECDPGVTDFDRQGVWTSVAQRFPGMLELRVEAGCTGDPDQLYVFAAVQELPTPPLELAAMLPSGQFWLAMSMQAQGLAALLDDWPELTRHRDPRIDAAMVASGVNEETVLRAVARMTSVGPVGTSKLQRLFRLGYHAASSLKEAVLLQLGIDPS